MLKGVKKNQQLPQYNEVFILRITFLYYLINRVNMYIEKKITIN